MKKDQLGNQVDIISGQIMSRVVVKEDSNDFAEIRKVIIPKTITAEGYIEVESLPEEKLKVEAPPERITKVNDIVIKLSTPFDSAVITEESEGCLVPSFCAIIRNHDSIDLDYLRAFLVSKQCKDQLKAKVTGPVMSILSIGKIKSVELPMPEKKVQQQIGKHYAEIQEKKQLMRKIIVLENKRNDILFQELTK